jgi:alkane 1-monooxygenase
MILFCCATLAPMAMIMAGALIGGPWPYAALLYMTALSFVLDRLIVVAPGDAGEGDEFPGAPRLLGVLGMLHFAILALAVSAVSGQAGLSWPARISLGLASGLVFGQIGHPAAHELIHKWGRGLRLLGRMIYGSLLVGHRASAHLLVHHVHVASDADPSSARRGEGF